MQRLGFEARKLSQRQNHYIYLLSPYYDISIDMKLIYLLFLFNSVAAAASELVPFEIKEFPSRLQCDVWELPILLGMPEKSLGIRELSINFENEPLIELVNPADQVVDIRIGQKNVLGRLINNKYENCFYNGQYSNGKYLVAYQCHLGDQFSITKAYSALIINYRSASAEHRICKIVDNSNTSRNRCLALRDCK